jgi:hypothetical protein
LREGSYAGGRGQKENQMCNLNVEQLIEYRANRGVISNLDAKLLFLYNSIAMKIEMMLITKILSNDLGRLLVWVTAQ